MLCCKVVRTLGKSAVLLLIAVQGAMAQEQQDVAKLLQAMESRIKALEGQVAALEAALVAAGRATPEAAPAVTQVSPASPPALTSAPTAQVASDPTASARLLNPAISVIGNLIGSAGKSRADVVSNPLGPLASMEMAESEVAFSAAVDPYSRADFFLSFGPEGVDLEEGYLTFPSVPGGFLVKAGKTRAQFGKANTMHRHTLPWVDRPLVTANLLGGEEGLSDGGFSVSRILPVPGGLFLEATGEIYRGNFGDVFEASQRSDIATVAHLRSYKDLSESSNLDVGVSYARGRNGTGESLATNLYGVDTTLRWKPLRRAIYRSFVGRSELVWSQRREPDGLRRAFGYYVSGEYQLARRWFAGARFDRSDRSEFPAMRDTGGSLILTYWPSEFSQIRAQYRLTDYAENIRANELLCQLQYSIGAHGAHVF